jgi:hypothetical protein
MIRKKGKGTRHKGIRDWALRDKGQGTKGRG